MTTTTTNIETKQLKELSKLELLIVKSAIAIFGITINICCIQLFS